MLRVWVFPKEGSGNIQRTWFYSLRMCKKRLQHVRRSMSRATRWTVLRFPCCYGNRTA